MTPPTLGCLASTTFTMRKSSSPPPVINQSARYKLKLPRHFSEMVYQFLTFETDQFLFLAIRDI